MHVTAFHPDYFAPAAELFVQNFNELRQAVPILPAAFGDPARVCQSLNYLFPACPGVMALEDDRLVGYMGWFTVPGFRGTARKAAYCPEWGHAAAAANRHAIYQAMYREAAGHWFAAGCQTHALTLLAHDQQAQNTWFWNGFGLHVVDGIRPLTPVSMSAPAPFTIRKAVESDLDALAVIEAEHWGHYSQPPTLMTFQEVRDQQALAEFIHTPNNTIWLALDGTDIAAFMTFEGSSSGAADIVNAEKTTAITGAYTRPQYRGKRAAVGILNAAFQHYNSLGYERCSVDFESLNPEAVTFWMKHFQAACLSVIRVPERES